MSSYIHNIFHSPTKFFITNFFFWGLIFFFLIPPFQAPDEQVHFPRVFELSCGKILLSKNEKVGGAYLPTSVQKFMSIRDTIPFHKEVKFDYTSLYQHLMTPLNEKETTFILFGTQTYSPLQYIPQVLGVSIGKVCNTSVCILYYVGKFFSLCIIGALLYLSIRYMPFNKWVTVMFCLSPMSIFLTVSHSSDSMIFACAFLFIAIILRSIYDTSFRLTVSTVVLLLLCVATLATSKSGIYFPIVLIVVLIPHSTFFKKKYSYLFKGMLLSIGVILALFWNIKTKFIIDQLSSGNFFKDTHVFYSYAYIQLVLYTFITLAKRLYLSFFTLGWLDTPLPETISYCWGYIIVLLSIFFTNITYRISLLTRVIFLSISLAISVGIVTSMYLVCGTTEENVINGIQGRYFFPISILFLTGCSNFFSIVNDNFFYKLKYILFDKLCLVQFFLLIFLATTVYIVFYRYYIS